MTLPTIAIGLLALVANAPSPTIPSSGSPPKGLVPHRDAGAAASTEGPESTPDAASSRPASDGVPGIAAIDHASAVVVRDSATVFVDPVGDQARYAAHGRPDVVVLTRHPRDACVDGHRRREGGEARVVLTCSVACVPSVSPIDPSSIVRDATRATRAGTSG